MDPYGDSSDRDAVDYCLFALAFIGFLILLGGVVTASSIATFAGGLVMLLVFIVFQLRPSPAED